VKSIDRCTMTVLQASRVRDAHAEDITCTPARYRGTDVE